MLDRNKIRDLFELLKMNNVKHAWLSAEAACKFGTSIYKTVTGEEVHVTCVADDENYFPNHYIWKDTVYVGLVKEYVRQGCSGIFTDDMFTWQDFEF